MKLLKLTDPETKYAIPPEGCDDYLTPGKRYEIIYKDHFGTFFEITDDDGEKLSPCLPTNCSFLCGGNWTFSQPMKTLHLTLKSQWYDMIASGEKLEEYREIKSYWLRRLFDYYTYGIELERGEIGEVIQQLRDHDYTLKELDDWAGWSPAKFEVVHFARGGHFHPSIPQMTLECKGIDIGKGNPEWGAPADKEVFIIKLGKIIS